MGVFYKNLSILITTLLYVFDLVNLPRLTLRGILSAEPRTNGAGPESSFPWFSIYSLINFGKGAIPERPLRILRALYKSYIRVPSFLL